MKAWVWLGSFIIMIMAAIFIVFVHIYKFINSAVSGGKMKDPFHDSRKHPLNDPNAPRG